MTTLILEKIDETTKSTVSVLKEKTGKVLCYVVEDGFKAIKEYGETRIPSGHYKLIKRKYGGFYQRYKRSFRHDYVIQLEAVPLFTDILIHIGNTVNDTKGCLLLNTGITKGKDGHYRGIQSTRAYLHFYEYINNIFSEGGDVHLLILR